MVPSPKVKKKKRTSKGKTLKKPISHLDSSKNTDKIQILSRNLLRLYQYISNNKPIRQIDLLRELDMNTPNESLRNEIEELKIELEALFEENHALRQNALQNQIEVEEQLMARKIEIAELNEHLDQIGKDGKEKSTLLTEKYETRIACGYRGFWLFRQMHRQEAA